MSDTTTETPQQRMKALLAKVGVPFKEIECYGSQIVITAWSRDAAEKWAGVLARFATYRGTVQSVDYNKINRGTVLRRTAHDVWRVYARLG